MNWDFKDQLKSVDLGGGGNAYYNYDSKGRRSRKVWEKSPGVIEERLYIGDFEIFRRRNGAGDIIFERETLHVRENSSDSRGTGKNMMDTEDSDPEEFRGFREKTGQEELSERNGKEKKNENGGSGKTAMFRYRIGAGSVADSALDISEQTAAPHFVMIETRTVGDDGSPLQLISYQYDNHLGSATLELDGSASIISYEEYYPYGMSSYQAVTSQREVCKKRYRFTGKERDEESGLYYFGARYYDAELGLWTAVDPPEEFWSPYRYTTNPIGFIDIQGLAEFRAALYITDQETPGGKIENVNWENVDLASIELTVNMNLPKGDNFKIKAFSADTKAEMLKFIGEGDVSSILAHGGAKSLNVGDVVQSKKKNLVSLSSLDKASKGKTYVYSCGAPEAIKNTGDYKKLEPGANTSGHPELDTMLKSIINFFSNGAKDQ